MLKKKYNQLNRKLALETKVFNFWIKVAQAANRKAGMANMRCKLITEEMIKVSDEMLYQTEETTKMSK